MFSGGGGGGGGRQSGGGQSQLMGMAMGEASKLFDQQNSQGNVQNGADKQSAINSAGKMALQMVSKSRKICRRMLNKSQYMKSQGGGSGGLMSLASKFF